MKTEKIITKTSSRCLNVSASKVESLRINDDLENTVRVYDNGAIGVDGVLGNADFNAMEQSARKKLSQGIPYPETHGKPMTLPQTPPKRFVRQRIYPADIGSLRTSRAGKHRFFFQQQSYAKRYGQNVRKFRRNAAQIQRQSIYMLVSH